VASGAAPKSVQKLQKALHAKAKAEAGRSNKGAPGVDGQEFADIEAYGVQRCSLPGSSNRLRDCGDARFIG